MDQEMLLRITWDERSVAYAVAGRYAAGEVKKYDLFGILSNKWVMVNQMLVCQFYIYFPLAQ